MFELAQGYLQSGMSAYSQLQQREFANFEQGYDAVKHQRFVGTGYFDQVTQVVGQGMASTTALAGSTEEEQFAAAAPKPTNGNGRCEAPVPALCEHRPITSPCVICHAMPCP